jgi:hypothetical protein
VLSPAIASKTQATDTDILQCYTTLFDKPQLSQGKDNAEDKFSEYNSIALAATCPHVSFAGGMDEKERKKALSKQRKAEAKAKLQEENGGPSITFHLSNRY